MNPPRQRRRGRRNVGHAGSSERWAVSYADLLTLLFAFFTTLYAMSNVDQGKVDELEEALRDAFAHEAPPAPIPMAAPAWCAAAPELVEAPVAPDDAELSGPVWTEAERAARHRLEDRMRRLLRDPALGSRVAMSPDPRGVRLTLGAAAFFEPGSATLRAEATAALAVLGEALADDTAEIVVEGHTDDTPVRGGPFRSNWELSTARATEVVAILVETYGVPADRMSAAGYAEHRPVAGNASPEGRGHNRRVDIVVIPGVHR